MSERRAVILRVAGLCSCLVAPGLSVSDAQAADRRRNIVVEVPVICVAPEGEICVPRVLPGTVVKEYPYGRLRQNYIPYGMPGVSARQYFTYTEPNRQLPVKPMGKYPEVHRID